MELDKSILLQKQVKDNSEDLQSEFLDMINWEKEMRQKDEELRKEHSGEIVLPPIRSKKNKKPEKSVSNQTSGDSKRIKSYDYSSWDKFDVEKACEEIDKENNSEDSEGEAMSKKELEKAHEVATTHKQQGNRFVQEQKWDKAVACYSEAIKTFPYDAVFYANRALCYLKMDNLHCAETDCSTAIQLDETYVKAYHRRATARMGLKQYKEAKLDLEKILKLEPSNKEAKSLLAQVEKKLESSKPIVISSVDVSENTSVEKKIGEKLCISKDSTSKKDKETKDVRKTKSEKPKTAETKEPKRDPRIPDWLPEKDNVSIVKPISKPPHLRSKKPLTKIHIEEVEFGVTRDTEHKAKISRTEQQLETPERSESAKEESAFSEKNGFLKTSESSESSTKPMSVPKTAVQFLMTWKQDKSAEFRYQYLKQLPPRCLPQVFQDSMESDIFSDILTILSTEFIKRKDPVFQYLKDLSQVKRFRALIMFISNKDKEGLRTLFEYCTTTESCLEKEIIELRKVYEI